MPHRGDGEGGVGTGEKKEERETESTYNELLLVENLERLMIRPATKLTNSCRIFKCNKTATKVNPTFYPAYTYIAMAATSLFYFWSVSVRADLRFFLGLLKGGGEGGFQISPIFSRNKEIKKEAKLEGNLLDGWKAENTK